MVDGSLHTVVKKIREHNNIDNVYAYWYDKSIHLGKKGVCFMRRVKIGSITLALSLVISMVSFSVRPLTVQANGVTPFSGYGDGTQESPYRVATCAQLQSMNDHKAATYELVANIDCDGVTFTSIGEYSTDDFTGNLYGNNHTIKNLNVDGIGFFESAIGSTIKDFRIESGTVASPNTAGSIVGIIGGTATVTNVHSNMDISSNGGYTGGLIGMIFGDDGPFTLSKSSFSGTVGAPGGYVGGLVGGIFIDDVSIQDSFMNGVLDASSAYSGGALSGMFSSTTVVQRIYSSGTINMTNSKLYTGGLTGGFFDGSISDSFSASLKSGTGTIGGLWGSGDNGISTNNWFDLFRAGTGNCVFGGSNTCSGATNSQAAPEVWRSSDLTTPLDTWDFSSIWQAQENDYPTLRGLQEMLVASNVPNNGDANGDGTDDSYQANVKSLPNDSEIWSTIETPANSNCTIENPQWSNPYSNQTDVGFSPQLTTTTGFEVYCPTAGSTVEITVIYDKLYDTSKSVLRYYNPTTNTFRTVSGATFGTRTVGGVSKTTVTYTITDGGSFDSDGIANKIIKDPVMLSSITAGVPNAGFLQQKQDRSQYLSLMTLLFSASLLSVMVRKQYQ